MDKISPYICAHGPEEDAFEAVMCTVGAASQISCCLLKILFLIQNITCKSLQEFHGCTLDKKENLF